MTDAPRIARATIELEGVEPPVRRVVDLPLAISLADLHEIVQAAMGWTNSHLYQFVVGETPYGVPDPDWDDPEMPMRDAARAPLADLLAGREGRIAYVYDFGDDWVHRIAITPLDIAEADASYPRLVEGTGRCPPEDVGGVTGFFEFLAAITDPRSREHREMLRWYGGPFEPADIGEAQIRERLDEVAARLARKAARRIGPKLKGGPRTARGTAARPRAAPRR
jgi:hypothetical protein